MTLEERRLARHSPDAAIAEVARWTAEHADEWEALLQDMGLTDLGDRPPGPHTVTLPPPKGIGSGTTRHLGELWTVRPWTDADLAEACQLTEGALRLQRHRYFRHRDWRIGRDAKGRQTRQLLPDAKGAAA